MSVRNPSGKSALELARIFYSNVLEELTPTTLFDASISIMAIIHLPHMTGEDVCDELTEMFDDGIFEKLLGKKLNEVCDLADVHGFVVKAHSQIWDWTDTVFNAEGVMDSCHNAAGSYVVYGFGKTLDEAYRAMVEDAVKKQAHAIENGLAAVKSSFVNRKS